MQHALRAMVSALLVRQFTTLDLKVGGNAPESTGFHTDPPALSVPVIQRSQFLGKHQRLPEAHGRGAGSRHFCTAGGRIRGGGNK